MVLEILIGPRGAERRPWEMIFFGFLYASIAIFLARWVFQNNASLVMVFLTVIASLYLVQMTLKLEEKKDIKIKEERLLLKEHFKALAVFILLFLGYAFAFSFWYIVLPPNEVNTIFDVQIQTIQEVNRVSSVSANAVQNAALFNVIFTNNIKVLLFCILFAFFYGAGALFILVWNASVVGTAMGSFVRSGIASMAQQVGLWNVAAYFQHYSLSLVRYLTHGSFEILAYFMAALGAGIISIAVVRHDFREGKFMHILFDSIDLIVMSILVLVVAALVEVYITPLFFS